MHPLLPPKKQRCACPSMAGPTTDMPASPCQIGATLAYTVKLWILTEEEGREEAPLSFRSLRAGWNKRMRKQRLDVHSMPALLMVSTDGRLSAGSPVDTHELSRVFGYSSH